MPSNDGNSASAKDCGVSCALTEKPNKIDKDKIDNEPVFIPKLYPQIAQISADYFTLTGRLRVLLSLRERIEVRAAILNLRKFAQICGYEWNSKRTRSCSALIHRRGSSPSSWARPGRSRFTGAK